MRKIILGVAAIMLLSAIPAASARARFIAYDGASARHTGTGGTSVAREGVEFWTNGTPPRRFEILGTLSDTRSSGPAAHDSVGSASLARQVRALGGDGLILANRFVRGDGFVGGWSGGDTIGLSGFRSNFTTSVFVVVRYLD